MGENVVFLVIFDTSDVMYNRSISLLPLIVLDKLFGKKQIGNISDKFGQKQTNKNTNCGKKNFGKTDILQYMSATPQKT